MSMTLNEKKGKYGEPIPYTVIPRAERLYKWMKSALPNRMGDPTAFVADNVLMLPEFTSLDPYAPFLESEGLLDVPVTIQNVGGFQALTFHLQPSPGDKAGEVLDGIIDLLKPFVERKEKCTEPVIQSLYRAWANQQGHVQKGSWIAPRTFCLPEGVLSEVPMFDTDWLSGMIGKEFLALEHLSLARGYYNSEMERFEFEMRPDHV